jgi:hypothetical protein
MRYKNKKAAMEMSVGTIVTIVLLMSVLVLGIFLIQKIFGGSQDAVDQINDQVQNEIHKLFSEEGKTLAIYPASTEIPLKRGDTAGFAFSFFNKDVESHSYTWTIEAASTFDFVGKCGSGMTKEKADDFLIISENSFDLGGSTQMESAYNIKFSIPEEAPRCTIPYNFKIERDDGTPYGSPIFITIK